MNRSARSGGRRCWSASAACCCIIRPSAATFNLGSSLRPDLPVFFYALVVMAARRLQTTDSSATNNPTTVRWSTWPHH
ncbi:MAG: hypothetical protein R3A10_21985 [Caldilineaceae bacterium]